MNRYFRKRTLYWQALTCEARPWRLRAVAAAALWLLGAFAALCLGMLMASCATPKTITVDRVVPVIQVKRCAEKEPPTFVKVPRPSTCVTGKLCWSLDDAANLAENIERLKEWVVTTWSLCAPVPQ